MRANRHPDAAGLLADVRARAAALGSEPLLVRADALVKASRGHGLGGEAWRPLTVREFEVARFIAEGSTNVQIAAELGLSPRTVSAHVEHILAKLGAARRTEIASWVSSIPPSALPDPSSAPSLAVASSVRRSS
jgi:DNA-binding NarL/FixJ family response regulator